MCKFKEKHRLRVCKTIAGSEVKKSRFNILDYLFRQMQEELFNQALTDGLNVEECFFAIKLELILQKYSVE